MIPKEMLAIATKTFEAYPGPCTTEEAMEAALTATLSSQFEFAPKCPRCGWRSSVYEKLPALSSQWRGMESAPRDGTLFLVWAPSKYGLPSMFSLCAWHPDAGFCIDELREASHWMPLPSPPEEKAE